MAGFIQFIIFVLITINFSGCAFKLVRRTKSIVYEKTFSETVPGQKLNVFEPLKRKNLCPVIIFIHGGNWNSGKRLLYNFMGNRMARKGYVSVTIDYPLSPAAKYDQMAMSAARSVLWVSENISKYGGDTNKIFISGHSAGGHLASLISVDNQYFDSLHIKNPLKGTILIDAAGLDMYGYLKEEKLAPEHTYFKTFSFDPAVWKAATPLYHLNSSVPPMLILRGEKTYPSIIKSNEKFVASVKHYTVPFTYKIQKNKKHIPMIAQFLWPWNPMYREIKCFVSSR